MKETLEQLIKERRGYKFLNKDGTSPYKKYQYTLQNKKPITTPILNTNENESCGAGWNLATLKWIFDNCLGLGGIIVEFTIPQEAQIIVPHNSDGKFRTDIVQIKKIYKIESVFPFLKNIKKRLDSYAFINPINAEIMPPENKIRELMAQLRAQLRDQVWDQVWAQLRAQLRAQVGDQVGDQLRAQVRDQLRDQVGIITYWAIKDFFNLDYNHPAFDVIRLGIIIIVVGSKFKVFGKNGKYLGLIDIEEVK